MPVSLCQSGTPISTDGKPVCRVVTRGKRGRLAKLYLVLFRIRPPCRSIYGYQPRSTRTRQAVASVGASELKLLVCGDMAGDYARRDEIWCSLRWRICENRRQMATINGCTPLWNFHTSSCPVSFSKSKKKEEKKLPRILPAWISCPNIYR